MKTLLFVCFILILIILLTACKAPHDPRQSWDQEHLKRHDVGCPSAVYIAPDGELQQC